MSAALALPHAAGQIISYLEISQDHPASLCAAQP